MNNLKNTQKKLVLDWCREFGYIIPAKMSGNYYKGQMFGSETSKRCRELRQSGSLISYKEGKFTAFKIKPYVPLTPEAEEERKKQLLIFAQS